MSPIHIGTSGWNYPTGKGTWNGVFYPSRRPRGFDELEYYAAHFDTVEVNSTFYRVPEPTLSQSWLRRTPASFEFSVKLYQKFTHPDMYLARPGVRDWDVSQGDLDQFRAGIDPIAAAGRLTAVLLQFPPSFHAGPETHDYLEWLLNALRGYALAVELRHESWLGSRDDTRARLAAHGATWATTDEPFGPQILSDQHEVRESTGARVREFTREVPGADGLTVPPPEGRERLERPPSPPSLAGTDLTYIRLHGRNAAQWWTHEAAEDRYDYLYSPAELAPVAAAARAAAQHHKRVVLYLNNHFSAKAVANAAVLKHMLGEPVPGEYPREMVERYPDLAGIVHVPGLPL